MKIITDSREQKNQHVLAEFSKQDISFKVEKLNQGDYSIDGYKNSIIIERKASLTELAGNFCTGRKRFEAEFVRAKEAGAKIYLLIEDEKAKDRMILRKKYDRYIKKIEDKWMWIENEEFPKITLQKALNRTWNSFYTANSMIASLDSWIKKYDINIVFCSKKDSGQIIMDIFQKYLSETIK